MEYNPILWRLSLIPIIILIGLCLARLTLFIYDYPQKLLAKITNKKIPKNVERLINLIQKTRYLDHFPFDTINKLQHIHLMSTDNARKVCHKLMGYLDCSLDSLNIDCLLCELDYYLEQKAKYENIIQMRTKEPWVISFLRKKR